MVESSTRTVERALELLVVVCDRGRVTLSEAARQVELSPSTALRLLRTLQIKGFVRRDSGGQYLLGGRAFQLGLRALNGNFLVDLILPVMERVVEETGESVYLSVLGRAGTATYIAVLDGTQAVRHSSWVGASIPLEGTAAGVVLTGATPEAGFAVVEGQVESGATAIAIPIRSDDRVLAAISIVAPTFRCTDGSVRRWGELLLTETAGLLGSKLTSSAVAEGAA